MSVGAARIGIAGPWWLHHIWLNCFFFLCRIFSEFNQNVPVSNESDDELVLVHKYDEMMKSDPNFQETFLLKSASGIAVIQLMLT